MQNVEINKTYYTSNSIPGVSTIGTTEEPAYNTHPSFYNQQGMYNANGNNFPQAYNNLAPPNNGTVMQNYQTAYPQPISTVPQQTGPFISTMGFQNIGQGIMPMQLTIPDSVVKIQRWVSIVCYTILWISALGVLIGYTIFLKKCVPPLDLFETGNWWTFLILMLSCIITMGVTGLALFLMGCTEGEIRCQLMSWFDLVLMLSWFIVLFVGIGAAESSSKSRGGPQQPTYFGKYITSVCGNGTAQSEEIIKNNTYDPEKCSATKRLQIGIFCMYSWAIEAMLVTMFAAKLGLGSWANRRYGGSW